MLTICCSRRTLRSYDTRMQRKAELEVRVRGVMLNLHQPNAPSCRPLEGATTIDRRTAGLVTAACMHA